MTNRFILLFYFIFPLPFACASEPKIDKIENKWEKCRDKAESSVDQQKIGIKGVEETILERCGRRPIVRTKSGAILPESDCNWLYG